jgi:hypothetical protein
MTAGGDWPLVGGATCDLLAAGRTGSEKRTENTERRQRARSAERVSVGQALVVCGYLAENGERCVGFDREVCDRGCVTERVIASASV